MLWWVMVWRLVMVMGGCFPLLLLLLLNLNLNIKERVRPGRERESLTRQGRREKKKLK